LAAWSLTGLRALADRFLAHLGALQQEAVAQEFETLQQLASNVANDSELAILSAKILQRQQVFDDVRRVFRLIDPTGDQQPSLPEFEEKRIREIKDLPAEAAPFSRPSITPSTKGPGAVRL